MKPAKSASTPSGTVGPPPAGGTQRRRARKTNAATVKLDDVARVAGVSTASVSRALNTPELVSQTLRERVMKAVRELNWVPNGPAKALASLRTRTVGALIPTLGHQNFALLVDTLQRELGKARYTLFIGCVDNSAELRIQQGFKMVEQGVEFLVLVGEAQPQELYDMLDSRNVAHVITYTNAKKTQRPCIGFDNYDAAFRITDHLLALGHLNFAMIAPPDQMNDRIQQRIAGARDRLAQAGIAIRPQHFTRADSRAIEGGRTGMRTILAAEGSRPTALICANDYLASGALIEARARGISVPGDLSVVGFDDTEMSAHLDPPLTTIRVPSREMGEEIARHILRVLDDGVNKLPPPLEAKLVIRGSTAPPAAQR
jgi:LacI family transcriptional regulator